MELNEHKKSLCRVCLKCDPTTQLSGACIFDKTEDVFIYEKLNTLCDVEIKPEDGLPDRICVECLLELHNAVRFKHKCESSNKLLLSAVYTNTDSGIKEEVIQDVKLEEDHYAEHEYLDEHVLEQEEEVHSPLDDEKYEHGTLQQEKDIQPAQQTMIETPSKAIDLKLECHDCGGLFKTKCKMKVHWNKEHLKQHLTCTCKKVFSTFKAFNNHKRKDFEICKKIEVMFHIEGTGKLTKFLCKLCEYSTSDRRAVKHHVRKHNGEKKFHCDLCPMSFFQIGCLFHHKEAHHQIYRREGPCDLCGEYIKGQYKLRLHMTSKHKKKDNGQFSCDICNKVYTNKKYLMVHISTHSGKTYSCDLCSKTFTMRNNLHTHKKHVHRGIKSYDMCPICGYSTNRDSMKAHMAKHNAGKCACTVCGKFFENDLQLTLHKQRHNERNHKCSQCDRTYFRRDCLLKHLNKVHKCYVNPKRNTDDTLNKSRVVIEGQKALK